LLSGFLFALGVIQPLPPRNSNMSEPKSNRLLSLDTWAVLLALVAALLVRLDLIKTVPW
jgi:hypothetical protein